MEANSFATDRSHRLPIQLPITYRPVGASHWRDGRTLNMSDTGLLCQVDVPLSPGTQVEVCMQMPTDLAARSRASIVYHGLVVRTFRPSPARGRPAVAIKVLCQRVP